MGDTINSSNLAKYFSQGNLDVISILLAILFAFAIGVFIFWVYHAN